MVILAMNERAIVQDLPPAELAQLNGAPPLAASASLLAALQLGDSFFPSGMFTQSHGLEGFIEQGLAGPEQFEPLLHSYLLDLAALGDALATRWVVRAAGSDDLELVSAVDARLDATKLTHESRIASARCGGRVLLLGAELFPQARVAGYADLVANGCAPGHQSVALALLAHAAGLDEEAAVLVELHTFAVSLVSAAVRLGALDHVSGQRILLHARPLLLEAAVKGQNMHWRDLGGYAPGIEMMQLRHAWAQMHMFVS
jgi:urease accessory protein